MSLQTLTFVSPLLRGQNRSIQTGPIYKKKNTKINSDHQWYSYILFNQSFIFFLIGNPRLDAAIASAIADAGVNGPTGSWKYSTEDCQEQTCPQRPWRWWKKSCCNENLLQLKTAALLCTVPFWVLPQCVYARLTETWSCLSLVAWFTRSARQL